MSRIVKTLNLKDVFTFSEFHGMEVKEAIDRHPKQILKMNSLGHFVLEDEAMVYLKEQLL